MKEPNEDLLSIFGKLIKNNRQEALNAVINSLLEILEQDFSTECTTPPHNITYALKRLIRGSASVNEETRLSFCSAFSRVIDKFSERIDFIYLLTEMQNLLVPMELFGSLKLSRSQETALLSAKIGCLSVISEKYIDFFPSMDTDFLSGLVAEIVEISNLRSFLGFPAFKLLLHLYMRMGTKIMAPLIQALRKYPPSVHSVWFIYHSNIPKPEHYDKSFPKNVLLENSDAIFDTLVDSLSFLPEPHELWFNLIDFWERLGTLTMNYQFYIETKLTMSESLNKRLVAMEILCYIVHKNYELDFADDSPTLQWINSNIGATNLKRRTHIYQAFQNLFSSLLSFDTHPLMIKLIKLPNFGSFDSSMFERIFQKTSYLDVYQKMVLSHLESGISDRMLNEVLRLFKLKAELSHETLEAIISTILNSIVILKSSHNHLVSKFHIVLKVFVFELSTEFSEKLEKLANLVSKHNLIEICDDKVVHEQDHIISKILKKIKSSDQHHQSLDVSVNCLNASRLLLLFDPILITDCIEDVKKYAQKFLRSPDSKTVQKYVDILVDILMKFLSSSSPFLNILAHESFKRIAPFVSRSSCELIFSVLNTPNKASELDGILEEIEDEVDQNSESESGDDSLLTEFNFSDLSAKRLHESETEEFYLDDADSTELQMFDQKLCEIFRNRKQSQKEPRLAMKSSIDFKSRLVEWVRYLLDYRCEISDELRLFIIINSLESVHLNLDDKKTGVTISSNLCTSIKNSLRKKHLIINEDEIGSSILAKIREDHFWSKYQSWEITLFVFMQVTKKLDAKLYQAELEIMWSWACNSKKVQKSNFFDFFGKWCNFHSSSCLELIECSGFYSDLMLVNSHSLKLLLCSFMKPLLQITSKCADDSGDKRNIFAKGLFSFLTDYLLRIASERKTGLIVKESLKICRECLRIGNIPADFSRERINDLLKNFDKQQIRCLIFPAN